ncbi:MAG: glycogen-debranching protein [Verrucomicrobia bacterium]|nr:glycogen-debranching protein [Verrucomicrobiota bacterium]
MPGATWTAEGVNFCIFSKNARQVELFLYTSADSPEPLQIITLDPEIHRTYFFWHVFVEGLRPGAYYTWRVDGGRELVDLWARGVSDSVWNRQQAIRDPGAADNSIRAIVTTDSEVGSRKSPLTPDLNGAVIYELHVGGFTRHPSSGVQHPGTFSGMIEKIPYLQELGVTHVELLPVMAFDAQDVPPAVAARSLTNYWGYSPHSFFSPHPHFCVRPDHGTSRNEFRELVDALHAAGIRVILDVVFNHTAEGGADGPIINFKGFANDTFYLLDPADPRRYSNYSGCGNTINCNHPLVTRFIVNCLEWWVEEMGVDGFRFDLASVFVRGEDGTPLAHPPLPWDIELSRTLARLPLIAEAWDASGLYHVGGFPGLSWTEWNGRYRDVIRRFVRGDRGIIGEVASCIAGSSELYADDGRLPDNSINFITCHDGFTLRDLVSYNCKHNEANGEENRDGSNENLSWNCGAEGETDDAGVNTLRCRQAKNFIAILMASRGVPMLMAGDEILRTQHGNNNAWCQDNELSWLDWRLVQTEQSMFEFVRGTIGLRRRHPSLIRNAFFTGRPVPGRDILDITWHGIRLNEPAWHDGSTQFLAYTIAGVTVHEEDLHVILNMADLSIEVPLPTIADRNWYLAVDTFEHANSGIFLPANQRPVVSATWRVQPRSVLIFENRVGGTPL